MHRTSHYLGLDVHDVGDYFVHGKSRSLEPGMVITVEPGLYFPPEYDFLSAGVRGIGIRIEDDVLVTEKGNEVLTSACRS
jgi:Xaa-Pro aminopeptidase